MQYKYPTIVKTPLNQLEVNSISEEFNETLVRLSLMERNDFKINPNMVTLCKQVKGNLLQYKKVIPLMEHLSNKAVKKRHLKQIINFLGLEVEAQEVLAFSYEALLQYNIMDYKKQIKEICEIAVREQSFEKVLNQIKQVWKTISVECGEGETGIVLRNVDPIFEKFDEDIMKLNQIMGSPFIKFLEQEVVSLLKNLQRA